jgi:hypothetical protein
MELEAGKIPALMVPIIAGSAAQIGNISKESISRSVNSLPAPKHMKHQLRNIVDKSAGNVLASVTENTAKLGILSEKKHVNLHQTAINMNIEGHDYLSTKISGYDSSVSENQGHNHANIPSTNAHAYGIRTNANTLIKHDNPIVNNHYIKTAINSTCNYSTQYTTMATTDDSDETVTDKSWQVIEEKNKTTWGWILSKSEKITTIFSGKGDLPIDIKKTEYKKSEAPPRTKHNLTCAAKNGISSVGGSIANIALKSKFGDINGNKVVITKEDIASEANHGVRQYGIGIINDKIRQSVLAGTNFSARALGKSVTWIAGVVAVSKVIDIALRRKKQNKINLKEKAYRAKMDMKKELADRERQLIYPDNEPSLLQEAVDSVIHIGLATAQVISQVVKSPTTRKILGNTAVYGSVAIDTGRSIKHHLKSNTSAKEKAKGIILDTTCSAASVTAGSAAATGTTAAFAAFGNTAFWSTISTSAASTVIAPAMPFVVAATPVVAAGAVAAATSYGVYRGLNYLFGSKKKVD